MTKNTLKDLHDHLMARVEALGNEELCGEKLDAEVKRSKATTDVARTIVDNARIVLDAEKFVASAGPCPARDAKVLPPMLRGRSNHGPEAS